MAERYDPARGAWAATGQPTARWSPWAAVTLVPLIDGTVLALGGGERNDPATDAWAAAGRLSTMPIVFAATPLPDGRVLALGGGGHGEVAAAEVYDPGSGAWAPTAGMTVRRYDYDVAPLLSTGQVLMAGGNALLPDGRGGAPVADAEVYDPRTGAWSATGSMGTPRAGHSLTVLRNGTVLAAGGGTHAGALASAEVYDPGSGRWAPTGGMDAAP